MSGCGLVAASALQKVDLQDRLGEFSSEQEIFFGTFSCRQRPVAESSTLVSKTGITSSYVLRGFHAQYDHSFGALQVDE